MIRSDFAFEEPPALFVDFVAVLHCEFPLFETRVFFSAPVEKPKRHADRLDAEKQEFSSMRNPTEGGLPIAHLEIEAIKPKRSRLPMTETGYRSHYVAAD